MKATNSLVEKTYDLTKAFNELMVIKLCVARVWLGQAICIVIGESFLRIRVQFPKP
jgi:hypothetical protein